MPGRSIKGYRGEGSYQPSSPEYLAAFKDAFAGHRERENEKARVRRIQELRRSSAASPVNRTPTRSQAKRRAIAEQD